MFSKTTILDPHHKNYIRFKNISKHFIFKDFFFTLRLRLFFSLNAEYNFF